MVEPTPTEIARQQSLPSGIRGRPPEEIQRRQTLRGGQSIPGGGGRSAPAVDKPPRRPDGGARQVEEDVKIFQAREELTRIAEERERGFTRLETQRFLEQRLGRRAIPKLREATRRDIQRAKQTGVSLREEIRKEKIEIEELGEIEIKSSQVGLVPTDIIPVGERPKPPSRVKEFIRKVSGKFPKEEKGLIGLFGLDRTTEKVKSPIVETETFTTDVIPFIPTGEGTAAFTTREKTFFEKFKINPNDESSKKLKAEVDRIQASFSNQSLNETEANRQLEKATKDFTRTQILKGIPATATFGVVFGLLQATPLGPIANVLLGADLLLKREQIATQFVDFPVETGLSTASFLAGGLVGSKVGAGIKTRVSDIKINPENLDSVSFLAGTEKTKLTNNAIEVFPDIEVLFKKGKITDTIAYKIELKNGQTFKVLEVSKVLDSGKIDKQFIGFETKFAREGITRPQREVFVGRGVGQIKGTKGELFSRIIKFKQANTPLGRFVQRRFGSGKIIDIAERTQVTGLGRKGIVTGIETRTIAGILNSETAKSSLIKRVNNFILNLEKGGKFSPSQLKQFINLNKRLKGKKPFTDAEFNSFRVGALTETQIISILKNFRKTLERTDIENLKTIARRVIITKKEGVVGEAVTRGFERRPPILRKKPKTPLERTFAEESPIIKRGKELEKQKPFTQLLKTKKKGKAEVIQTPTSVSAAALAALSSLDKQKGSFVPVFSGGTLSLSLGLTPQGIKNNLLVIIDRKSFVDNEIFRLKSFPKLRPDLQNKLLVLEKQKLGLELREKLLNRTLQSMKTQQILKTNQLLQIRQELGLRQTLRQKQVLRQRLALRQRITRAGRRLVPPITKIIPFVPITKEGKKKPLKKTPLGMMGSFDVFSKKKGKLFRVSKKPFQTRSGARDFGASHVSRTLRASFMVKSSGRANPRKVKPKLRGFFERHRGEFRPSKVNKKIFVEIKQFRLNTKSEVKSIQKAKSIKKPFSKRL